MQSSHPQSRSHPYRLTLYLAIFALMAAIGCATPGVPKSPSLNLPEPVQDLSAVRTGNTVQLRYSLPTRSTDKLPLRGAIVSALFCLQSDSLTCEPIRSSRTVISLKSSAATTGHHTLITWTDTLHPDLSHGAPRILAYRVAISNAAGKSANYSASAFTVSGEPPAPIQDLSAEGSRLGILLHWRVNPTQAGEVAIQRENLTPAPPKLGRPQRSAVALPNIVQLTTPSEDALNNSLLDTSIQAKSTYRYTATRCITLQLGGRSIQISSSPSSPVEFTLRLVYPPLSPTGLTSAGFLSSDPKAAFVVDLIWQPADERGLIAPLAGYNLYREELTNEPYAARIRLNQAALTLPSFHDTTAKLHKRYRYSVTAVDSEGNESPATTNVLEAQPVP